MIVIADDITGAAEIAGIAFEAGEDVRLVCGDVTVTNGTTVIATDTRSMTEVEAIAETRRITSPNREGLSSKKQTPPYGVMW